MKSDHLNFAKKLPFATKSSVWAPSMLLIVSIIITASLLEPSLFPKWTGFGAGIQNLSTSKEVTLNHPIILEDRSGVITKLTVTERHEEAKTLWDWMNLLIAPASLAVFAAYLQSRQENAKVEQEEQDKRQVEDNQREEALRLYIDSISAILLDQHLRLLDGNTEDGNNKIRAAALDIIRAKTLSILRRLDGDLKVTLTENKSGRLNDGVRKAGVLLFLYEADLIRSNELHESKLLLYLHDVSFRGADLSRVNLSSIYLNGADLSHAKLVGAILNYADLSETNLSHVNFFGANLSHANLSGADLTKTNLFGANLSHANLSGVDLSHANLSKAILKGALVEQTKFTHSYGISPEFRADLRRRGAIFEDALNSHESLLSGESRDLNRNSPWCT